MRTVQIFIYGHVQGVFFRKFTKELADKIGLKGWVRNRKEGNVEALVIGEDSSVQEFIVELKKGPGKVEGIEFKDIHSENFSEFEVRKTK